MLYFTKKPFMLLGLPNTGTDWLASQICDSNKNLLYYREFFNPITNDLYPEEISEFFGCELSTTARNIAKKILPPDYKKTIKHTWKKTDFNFTKENYSAFQIENHQESFDCFILYRKLCESLPSQDQNPERRGAVINWYDSIYFSLIENQKQLEPDVADLVEFSKNKANSINKKIASAHVICYYKILKDAKKYKIPVINYSILTENRGEEIANHLQEMLVWKLANVDDVTKKILKTRKKRKITFPDLGCNDYLKEFEDFSEAFMKNHDLNIQIKKMDVNTHDNQQL